MGMEADDGKGSSGSGNNGGGDDSSLNISYFELVIMVRIMDYLL